MTFSKGVLSIGAVAAALAITAIPAIASHGKAGLWTVTVTMNMAGMPDMSRLPPEAQAAMRARGMSMNGHSMTVQHCMTQAEVDASGPPPMRNDQACKMSNMKMSGGTFSGDMTCSGSMNGTGHVEFVYDSPEHYTGKQTFSGSENGHPVSTTNTFDGRWVSADCKGVTH